MYRSRGKYSNLPRGKWLVYKRLLYELTDVSVPKSNLQKLSSYWNLGAWRIFKTSVMFVANLFVREFLRRFIRFFLHGIMRRFLHPFLLYFLLRWFCTNFLPFSTFTLFYFEPFYFSMGYKCCILQCKTNQPNGEKGSVAEFSTNEEDKQAWIRFVDRRDCVCSKHSRLCL